MPVLFTVIGYALLTAALIPVWEMISAAAGLVIAEDAPVFTSELKSIYDPSFQVQTPVEEEAFIRIEDIELPAAGTQYGNITCEKIGLNAPLYWDDTLEILRYGAGQNIASFMPGFGRILIIAGHNSTHFNVIQNIAVGDVIKIDTNYCPYEYEVQEVKVYDEDDLEELFTEHLLDEEETLYLYTCYPFTAHVGRRTDRMLVTAKRISGYDVKWRASQYEQ